MACQPMGPYLMVRSWNKLRQTHMSACDGSARTLHLGERPELRRVEVSHRRHDEEVENGSRRRRMKHTSAHMYNDP